MKASEPIRIIWMTEAWIRLESNDYELVAARSAEEFVQAKNEDFILAEACNSLFLAISRSHLDQKFDHGRFVRAIELLRRAGQLDELARGLVRRAELCPDQRLAEADLKESLQLCAQAEMCVIEVEARLAAARLSLRRTNLEDARAHLNRADQLIGTTGYELRVEAARDLRTRLWAS
ncbi:MAG: hypothetical protein HYV07_31845 [Deltaproteobacteria bacterium]|nr:hypothetical protein [Deltaproteobacteria bacterium]